ncbi:14_t:CDS:1, partial [Ambispora gerdemannii]
VQEANTFSIEIGYHKMLDQQTSRIYDRYLRKKELCYGRDADNLMEQLRNYFFAPASHIPILQCG